MDKLDSILFQAAGLADIQAQKDRVWIGLSRRKLARERALRYGLSAAAMACMFGTGWLAGSVWRQSEPPPVEIAIPKTDEIVIENEPEISGPDEIEIVIPKTDADTVLEYMEDVELGSPLYGDRIDAFLPKWTPETVSSPWIDSVTSWHCEGEAGYWVHGQLYGGEQLRNALDMDVEGLRSGYMRGCLIYDGVTLELLETRIIARMDGGKYLAVSFAGIPYPDGVKVLESICE